MYRVLIAILLAQAPFPAPRSPSQACEYASVVSRNLVLQSETIASGTSLVSPWTGGNLPAPTYSANQADSPFGGQTADLVNFGAVGSGTYSFIYQSFTALSGAYTGSVYAKTASGTGTLYMSLNSGTADTYSACPVSEAWTRCSVTRSMAAGTRYFFIGQDTRGGLAPQPALSVLLWGVQLEPGALATVYHATVGSQFTGWRAVCR